MKLNLNLTLIPNIKELPISFITHDSNKTHRIINDDPVIVNFSCDLDINSPIEKIKIISFSDFNSTAHQIIKIKDVMLNGKMQSNNDFFNLFSLQTQKNLYTKDQTIENCYEVAFNGCLSLDVKKNKERIFWSPWYKSKKRNDFVFQNSLLAEFNEDPDLISWSYDTRTSRKIFRNIPHHDYDSTKMFDIASFGCSVTYGTALKKQECWPNILSDNVINFGLPGLGIDGIFLNLQNALKKFNFRRVIILLPNLERRIVRYYNPNDDSVIRVSVTASTSDWEHNSFKHWAWGLAGIQFDLEQLKKWKKQHQKVAMSLVMDDNNIYSLKILDRLIKLMNSSKIPCYISSWNENTYNELTKRISTPKLLPMFQSLGDRARDNQHPGFNSHRNWVDQIKLLVN